MHVVNLQLKGRFCGMILRSGYFPIPFKDLLTRLFIINMHVKCETRVLAAKFLEGAEIAETRGFSGDTVEITTYNPSKQSKNKTKQKKKKMQVDLCEATYS